MTKRQSNGVATFNPIELGLGIGTGKIRGRDAKVAAAMLLHLMRVDGPGAHVPDVGDATDLTVDQLIDAYREICAHPELLASMEQLLADCKAKGTGTVRMVVTE